MFEWLETATPEQIQERLDNVHRMQLSCRRALAIMDCNIQFERAKVIYDRMDTEDADRGV